jgi:hypothetical protein
LLEEISNRGVFIKLIIEKSEGEPTVKNQNIDVELVEVLADEFEFEVSEVFVEVLEENDYSDKNKEFDANDFENQNYTIKLEFTEDDYNFVKDKLQQLGQSPEKILYDALVPL